MGEQAGSYKPHARALLMDSLTHGRPDLGADGLFTEACTSLSSEYRSAECRFSALRNSTSPSPQVHSDRSSRPSDDSSPIPMQLPKGF
ncbi:hypothetical protein R1flu_022625 [Riccia fluitans]|uniref:Uncharacterized protein n=1 Tax=Riccia fluitans TaxID=41844 RepID=A0ABD1XTS7_9MARC